MKFLTLILVANLLPISAQSQTCHDHFPKLKSRIVLELPPDRYIRGSDIPGGPRRRAWARQENIKIDGHELRYVTSEFGISNRDVDVQAQVRDNRREIDLQIFKLFAFPKKGITIEVPKELHGYIGNINLMLYSTFTYGTYVQLNIGLVTPGSFEKTFVSFNISGSGEITQVSSPVIDVPKPVVNKPAVVEPVAVEVEKPKAPEPPKLEVKKVDLPADWYESTLVEFREKFGKGDVEFVKTFLETHWDKIFVSEDNAYTKYLSWALRAAGDSYNPPIAVRLVLVQKLPSQHPLITYRNPEDSYSIVERNYQFAWDSRDKDYNELLRQLINKGGVVINHNSTSDLTRNIKNNHDFGRSLDSDVRNLILFHANKIGLRPPKRPY